jgi:hypothetical protein
MRVGIGDVKFGLKVNFYNNQHKGLYVSLYPQIEFNIPGTDAVEKGVAEQGQNVDIAPAGATGIQAPHNRR